MKTNHGKCHLLISGKKCATMNVNGFEQENTDCEKLFRTKVDCELKIFKNLFR